MKINVDVSTENGPLDLEIGIVSDLRVKHVVEKVFWREGDRTGMAATGAIAAAMGLSGPAAGMAMMSAEEMAEPVTRVEFRLGEIQVEGLLWNWPFSEGDRVKIVGSRIEGGRFFALSVLDEDKRLIVLYPHVSSGSWAHWIGVMKYTLMLSLPISILSTVAIGLGSLEFMRDGWIFVRSLLSIFGGLMVVSIFVALRIGWRFRCYTKLADAIFESLGWADGKYLNLRRSTKMNGGGGDHVALGDTYFKY